MSFCLACKWLRENAPNFILNGITEIECNHLRRDEGLVGVNRNADDLQKLVDCLIGSHGEELRAIQLCDIKDWLADLVNNLWQLKTAWVCNERGLWDNIQNILDRLDDIEDALKQSLSGSSVTLVQGVDYLLNFPNGWSTTSGDVDITAQINPFSTTINVNAISISQGTAPQRSTNIGGIISAGSGSDVASTPASWIMHVSFIGRFSALQTTPVANHQVHNTLWGVTPNSQRASHIYQMEGTSTLAQAATTGWRFTYGASQPIDGFTISTGTPLFANYSNITGVTAGRIQSTTTFMTSI